MSKVNISNKVIALDAGHSIQTYGKETPAFDDGTIIKEAEQNFAVMDLVNKYLKNMGFKTVICSKDINKDLTSNIKINADLKERVQIENKANADIFISFHSNAITGYWQTFAKGIETYCYKFGGEGEKIAKKIQNNLIVDTKMYNRGVKQANFYVLKNTKAPAVLVEIGFMDFKEDALHMKDSKWIEKYAKAIVKGICNYYSVEAVFLEEDENTTLYRVMAGSFNKRENAEKQIKKLKEKGIDACIMIR